MQDQADVQEDGEIAELREIKEDVDAGKERTASVRELLRWFGARRRRSGVVERIEAELRKLDLRTDPPFTTTWIDAQISFRKREAEAKADAPAMLDGANEEAGDDIIVGDLPDMTYLVRMLEAANREVVKVNPQDPIETAVTLMLANDFSQLAVMTGPRDLKGAISWKSIGSRLSQGKKIKEVSEAMEKAEEVLDTDSLFETTKTIIKCEYVFVRSSKDKTVTGIVTATDLSEQFQGLSEPFLLLGRIEHQIRRIIESTFDTETLRAACDDDNPDRKAKIEKASQLTFGEYQRIFENEGNWKKLKFIACRKTFCKELDEVRKLRNEIMHFHPDVIEDGDFEQLHRFSHLLEKLETLSK